MYFASVKVPQVLEENFAQVNGHYKSPEMLEKRELEAHRQQRLLRESEDILEQARRGQRLKDVLKEAVLAGFAQCCRDKRFEDILHVGRRLHKRIVESSTEIYDSIDIAEAKVDRMQTEEVATVRCMSGISQRTGSHSRNRR